MGESSGSDEKMFDGQKRKFGTAYPAVKKKTRTVKGMGVLKPATKGARGVKIESRGGAKSVGPSHRQATRGLMLSRTTSGAKREDELLRRRWLRRRQGVYVDDRRLAGGVSPSGERDHNMDAQRWGYQPDD